MSHAVAAKAKLRLADSGSAQGVNIMAFCKEYNAKTADKAGQIIPVAITVYDVRRLHRLVSKFRLFSQAIMNKIKNT